MKFLLLTFLFSIFAYTSADTICAPGYTLVNDSKCWKLFNNQTSEPDADESCRQNGGGILATLTTAIDNRALLSMFNGTDVSRVWIGLKCTGLSLSTCQWDDQSQVRYSSFASGFPNDRFGQCVYYSADGSPQGQWANGPCEDKLPYVCELPTTSSDFLNCTNNYNNHCYTPDNSTIEFSWAQKDCQTNLGNLASVHSYLENRYLTSLFDFDGSVWLGGLAPGAGLIVWTDGSNNNYYNLRTTGNGTCVSMDLHTDSSNGNWTSTDCASQLGYLCKRFTCSSDGHCP